LPVTEKTIPTSGSVICGPDQIRDAECEWKMDGEARALKADGKLQAEGTHREGVEATISLYHQQLTLLITDWRKR